MAADACLGAHEDFKKVSREQMKRGFVILRDFVLAEINRNPRISAFDFDKIDRDKKMIQPDCCHNIYDVFFGNEPIRVCRASGGKYSVVNGRHRITVARELGWQAVPASVE
jgi:hypothetical protein